MEDSKIEKTEEEENEEAQAEVEIWKYIFGFCNMATVKCAIELGIADAIDSHQQGLMTPLTVISKGRSTVQLKFSTTSVHRSLPLIFQLGTSLNLTSSVQSNDFICPGPVGS
ncbi:acetylserotonin O-methyltransferase-like [Mercurialis annua]|uniref:acetylserotonin O-methyltransferase-like n=1 Tax=Mercurialis annua TaxID=3986 RepID=UPI0024ADA2FA|nr:acetylserotonin O-methyltransferase-like [Mercurialis annua]